MIKLPLRGEASDLSSYKTVERMGLIVLLFLVLFSSVVAQVPYSSDYFEQKVDHFNFVEDATFKQRYLFTGKVVLQRAVL